jgi:hypothetical protein
MQKGPDGRPPQYSAHPHDISSNSQQNEAERVDDAGQKNLAYRRSPKTLRDALALGKASISKFDSTSSSPIDTTNLQGSNERGFNILKTPTSTDRPASPDSSPYLEQEDSLHSTSERNYMDNVYDMGRAKLSSKQSFGEVAYLSSLSSNTFGNQSMISSVNEGVNTTATHQSGNILSHVPQQQFAFRVDPTSEAANLLGSDLPSTMSPGPSMRSAHSMAQSMISVSPRGGDTPKFNPEFTYLMKSPSKRSAVDADPSEPILNDVVPHTSPSERDGNSGGLQRGPPEEPPEVSPEEPRESSPEAHQGPTSGNLESLLPIGSSYSARSSSPPGKSLLRLSSQLYFVVIGLIR